MKLSGAGLERWVASPTRESRAVLFYGPNEGLVRDRARTVVGCLSGGKADDPFAVSVCDQQARNANPAALLDEAFSFSMMGGDKVVWVRDAGDSLVDELSRVLQAEKPGNFVVVEAGDLAPRSKLRQVFEKDGSALTAGCYLDDDRALETLVRGKFQSAGVRVDKSALDVLVSRLGQDRLANLSEIEKLCLLAGPGGELHVEDVLAAVGDGMGDLLEDCLYALFDGRRDEADRLIARVFDDGVQPTQLVRRLLGHVDRLMTVRARADAGEAVKLAIGKLQPRVFFKYEPRFLRQVSLWNMDDLVRIQEALVRLEIDCKSTGLPAQALCQRAALSISGAAGRRN